MTGSDELVDIGSLYSETASIVPTVSLVARARKAGRTALRRPLVLPVQPGFAGCNKGSQREPSPKTANGLPERICAKYQLMWMPISV